MVFLSAQLHSHRALYFMGNAQVVSKDLLKDSFNFSRSGRLGAVASAAMTAAALHGAVLLWIETMPPPLPRSAAVPLAMISMELAAPRSPEIQPALAPPAVHQPVNAEKPQKPKPVLHRKPKPRPEPALAEKVAVEPDQPSQPPLPAAAAPPQSENHQALAAPVSDTVVPPKSNLAYLNNPKPVYPLDARQRHLEGLVVLKVFVTAEGNAQQVKVDRSSGHEMLDESALNAVREWRFVPAKRGDRTEAGWATVPINFSLS